MMSNIKENGGIYPKDSSNLRPLTSELTWRDGAEVVAEASNLIGIGGLVKLSLGLGKFSPEERLKAMQFKWLLDQIPKILEKLDALVSVLPPHELPETSDVAAIFKAALETSEKTVGSDKRKLLKNALVNAFDREQYKEGLTLKLFSILGNVEYGDIVLLRKYQQTHVLIHNLDRNSSALIYYHLDVLIKLNLILIWNHNQNEPLGKQTERTQTEITELGTRFLQFIAESE